MQGGILPLMDNDIRVAHHMRKALDLRLGQAVLTSSMSCRRETQSMDKVWWLANVNVPMWWSKWHICLCAQRVYWYRNYCLLFALYKKSPCRWKSDLDHVGVRWLGSFYVRYLELSREPRHVAQQMRYLNVGLSKGHCLGNRHHYNFLTEVTWPILRMHSISGYISIATTGRFGSNLLFGTSCYVSGVQPPSDSCHAGGADLYAA